MLFLNSLFFSLSELFKQAFARILSTIMSAIIFALLFKFLVSDDFVHIQIALGISGLLLWLTDFGLTSQAMIEIGNKRYSSGKKFAIYRIWTIAIVAVGLGLFSCLGTDHSFRAFVVLVMTLDLFTDSLINLRLTVRNFHSSQYSLVYKKFAQLLLLMMFLIGNSLNIENVAISLFLPSVLIFLFDCILIAKLLDDESNSGIGNSIKSWIQSGGIAVTGLDLWIIGGNQPGLIQSISVARKLSSFITIPVQSVIPHTVSRSYSDLKLSKHTKEERSALFIVFGLSIFCAISINPVLDHFFEKDFSISEKLLLIFMILVVPIGTSTFLNNLKLLKYGSFRDLSLINWFSSLIYLTCIVAGKMMNQVFLGFVLAIVLKISLELLGQKSAFKKIESFE
jgi:hypothetical protein